MCAAQFARPVTAATETELSEFTSAVARQLDVSAALGARNWQIRSSLTSGTLIVNAFGTEWRVLLSIPSWNAGACQQAVNVNIQRKRVGDLVKGCIDLRQVGNR